MRDADFTKNPEGEAEAASGKPTPLASHGGVSAAPPNSAAGKNVLPAGLVSGGQAMNSLTKWDPARWDPFRELEEISDRFNRVFGRLPARRESGREALTVADWVPTVDISEDEKEFVIKAEIPEVDKKDVKVTLQDGVLTVMGERKQEKEEKGKKFHRIERSYGKFVRAFTLPEEVDEAALKAEFKDGMLFVRLPKLERARPRAIEVKVE
jgi:HSP20 family protein